MNTTPRSIRPLEILANRILGGAAAIGVPIGLKANDLATLSGFVSDLFGRPADPTATPPEPAIPGKQPLYVEAKVQHAHARTELRIAFAAGRAFMTQAVNTLKGLLGTRWNSHWAPLGFPAGSLQLPKNPLPILTLLGAYYRAHPEHAVASLNLTAARADEVKLTLVRAQAGADAAKAAEKEAKKARDAAFKTLRMRIKGLRDELRCLLREDDTRWYSFGFRRPIDGETPDLIEELTLRPAGDGRIVAEWPPARLAENYRVSWQVSDSMEEPTPVGIVTDRQAIIADLPRGMAITVSVTSRNGAGESAPIQTTIFVPADAPPSVPSEGANSPVDRAG